MKTRRRFTAEFKAKVALEAIQGQRTIAELAARHELHPNLITQWKRQAIEKLAKVFDDKGFEVQAHRDAEVTKTLPISRLRCYLRLVRPVSAVRLFGRVPGSPLSVSLRQSALVFL